MALSSRDLVAKARAFTISIGKLDRDARRAQPSGLFGRDYNSLRAAAATLHPRLVEILPPAVQVHQDSLGQEFTEASYGELDTFCEQLVQILEEQKGS